MNSMAAAARQRLMRGSVVNINFLLPHVSMRLIARRQNTKFTAPMDRQNGTEDDPPKANVPKPVLKPMALSLLVMELTKKVSAMRQRRPDVLTGSHFILE